MIVEGNARANRLLIFVGRVVLRRPEFGQKLLRAFADIRNGAHASYGHREVVGENGIVEDDGGAGGAQTFQRFHERFARLRPKWDKSGLGIFLDLGGCLRCRDALKWNAQPCRMQTGTPKRFPLSESALRYCV